MLLAELLVQVLYNGQSMLPAAQVMGQNTYAAVKATHVDTCVGAYGAHTAAAHTLALLSLGLILNSFRCSVEGGWSRFDRSDQSCWLLYRAT
jgi:hypothetical protein